MYLNHIINFCSFSIIIIYMLYLNHSSMFILKDNSILKKFFNGISKFSFVYFILNVVYDICMSTITPYKGIISICKSLTFLYTIFVLNELIITKRLIIHNGNIILKKNITSYSLNGYMLQIKTKDTTLNINLKDNNKESVLLRVKSFSK